LQTGDVIPFHSWLVSFLYTRFLQSLYNEVGDEWAQYLKIQSDDNAFVAKSSAKEEIGSSPFIRGDAPADFYGLRNG
jgi:hypothetical protein